MKKRLLIAAAAMLALSGGAYAQDTTSMGAGSNDSGPRSTTAAQPGDTATGAQGKTTKRHAKAAKKHKRATGSTSGRGSGGTASGSSTSRSPAENPADYQRSDAPARQ